MQRVSMIRLEYDDWAELFGLWQTPALPQPSVELFEAQVLRFSAPASEGSARRAQRSPFAVQMWKRPIGKPRGCHRCVGIVTLFAMPLCWSPAKSAHKRSLSCLLARQIKQLCFLPLRKVPTFSTCIDPRVWKGSAERLGERTTMNSCSSTIRARGLVRTRFDSGRIIMSECSRASLSRAIGSAARFEGVLGDTRVTQDGRQQQDIYSNEG